VALDADNVEGLLWHGWFEKEATNLPVTKSSTEAEGGVV
jgi:hypothetical protein